MRRTRLSPFARARRKQRLRHLVAATAARADFVADAAHELRTPIAAIQGYAETLLTLDANDAHAKEFLAIIHRQATRLGVLVEQLLTLASLDAPRTSRAPREAFDIAGVARHVIETVRARADAAGVTLALDARDACIVVGDAAATEEVIENLVDNAIKYGRAGGAVCVTVRATGDARVALEVRDDGDGIDAGHLPHVFERFYRADGADSRARAGAGLGLAIVKRLVAAMGGAVSVASKVGHGTSFVVELPRATPDR